MLRAPHARTTLSAFACALACALAAPPAFAGAAWGDATLRGDDARVEIDRGGRATVTHTITIHVAAKRFRVFAIDGVDDHLQAPEDEQTAKGRDGLGWPLSAVEARGTTYDAFAEPAKEPRRLRIRLGQDGVPRGDYTLKLRYVVDLAGQGTLVRDGTMLRFAWAPPRWPEGYDNGRIVFAVPAGPTAPTVSLLRGDVADGAAQREVESEGTALVVVRRGPAFDEVELTRPHVPHADDAQWVVRVDPKALPEVAARLGPVDPVTGTFEPERRPTGGRLLIAMGAALLAGLAMALVVRRRDADVARLHRGPVRAVLPWPAGPLSRACSLGLLTFASVCASAVAKWSVSFVLLLVVLALVALRPQRLSDPVRCKGRWLAVPEGFVQRARSEARGLAPFDPGTRLGVVTLLVAVFAVAVAMIALSRTRVVLSVALAMHAMVLVPLFGSGRKGQLPPRPYDVWQRLVPYARAFRRATNVRTKIIARVPRGPAEDAGAPFDEVRLRLEPSAAWSGDGIVLEVGCGIVQGVGAATLMPEMLVRFRKGSTAEAAFERRLERAGTSATFHFSLGKSPDERVLAIRPAFVSPRALAAWATWAIQVAHGRATTPSPAASELPAVTSPLTARADGI